MKFILIRHSKSEYRPEIPIVTWGLTDEGINLAKDLAKDELIKTLDVIYSSTETKALETAVYLAKPNGKLIIPNKELIEVTSITNKIFPNFEVMVREFFEEKVEKWYDGETINAAKQRFFSALGVIASEEVRKGSENVGIVSHGSIYTLFTKDYCDKPIWELHQSIKMPDVAVFDWQDKKFIKYWRSWENILKEGELYG